MTSPLREFMYEAAAKEVAARVHAVVVANLETGEILHANPLAKTMFGYQPGELSGQCVDVLVPDDARARHASHRKEFSQQPRSRPMGHGMVLFGRRKDDSTFPIQVTLDVIEVSGRNVVVSTIIDLTSPIETAVRIRNAMRHADDTQTAHE